MEFPFLSENEKAMAEQAKNRIKNKFLDPKIIIPLFAVVVVLLLGVSLVTVHYEKKQQNSSTEASLSQEEISSSSVGAQSSDFNANILIAYADASDRDLHMLGVLHANSDDGCLEIRYIDPGVQIKVNNFDGTMTEHYRHGGVNELIWAVRESLVTQIDRYIITDDDSFTNAVKMLGETEITLEKSINANYKGINFTIDKGTQKLTADMMQKYFTCLCESAYTGSEAELTDMLAYLFSKFLKPETETTVEDLYENIVNYLITDISVIDLTEYSAAAVSLLDGDGELKIETK